MAIEPFGGPPLAGIRVVELAAIGPVPLAGMLLADLGADVVRIDRVARGELDVIGSESPDPVLRGRRIISADLSDAATNASVRQLIGHADVLIEGMRPGAAERLGIGPDQCCPTNRRLVYARMTGWGQTGPDALTAGHDLNYLAITGALQAIGPRAEPPPVPLNLIGDYGAGSTFLVMGILAALLERARTGAGQVVDAAMIDGISVLLQPLLSWRSAGLWSDRRESNLLDGAAPYYATYTCSDGRFVAVGAIENRFYDELVAGLELEVGQLPDRADRENWPRLRALFTATFVSRTRDDWAAVFSGTDACVTPVLTFEEAPDHPQMAARGSLQRVGGTIQAAAAPRFSHSTAGSGAPAISTTIEEVRHGWLLSDGSGNRG